MTALEKYRQQAFARRYPDEPGCYIDLADAAIESLKCCGSCRYCDVSAWAGPIVLCALQLSTTTMDAYGVVPGQGCEAEVALGSKCRLIPSRWKECIP